MRDIKETERAEAQKDPGWIVCPEDGKTLCAVFKGWYDYNQEDGEKYCQQFCRTHKDSKAPPPRRRAASDRKFQARKRPGHGWKGAGLDRRIKRPYEVPAIGRVVDNGLRLAIRGEPVGPKKAKPEKQ